MKNRLSHAHIRGKRVPGRRTSKQKGSRQGVLGILRTCRWHFEELVTEIPPAETLTGDPEVDGK